MNIKKAVGAGLLVFAIQFAAVSVAGNTLGPILGSSAWAGYLWQAIMIALLMAIVYCTAKWYFADNTANWINGLYLGLIFVVTSFTINLLQTIPALMAGRDVLGPIQTYISGWPFWITVAITIAATTLSGYISGKCTACNTSTTT